MPSSAGKNILRTNIEDVVNLDDQTSIIEFYPPVKWVGKTLGQLDLRNKYDINIIGLRKHRGERLDVSFSGDYIVDKDIVLVGITESDVFERYDYLNQLT